MTPDPNEIERILAEEGILSDVKSDPQSKPEAPHCKSCDAIMILDASGTEWECPNRTVGCKQSDRIDVFMLSPNVPQDSLSTDAACKHCGIMTRRVCPTCHGPFCELCASILDPVYCKLCLDEPAAQLTVTPLKDADGETHQGKDIHVSGPAFGTLCKRISDMSAYELEAHIDYYKDLVRQAEKSLDFRRVVLGASQIELAQRKDGERRRLRGIKVPGIKRVATDATGAIIDPAKQAAKAKRDPVKDLAAVMGIKTEDMSKLLSLLMSSPKGKKQ